MTLLCIYSMYDPKPDGHVFNFIPVVQWNTKIKSIIPDFQHWGHKLRFCRQFFLLFFCCCFFSHHRCWISCFAGSRKNTMRRTHALWMNTGPTHCSCSNSESTTVILFLFSQSFPPSRLTLNSCVRVKISLSTASFDGNLVVNSSNCQIQSGQFELRHCQK